MTEAAACKCTYRSDRREDEKCQKSQANNDYLQTFDRLKATAVK